MPAKDKYGKNDSIKFETGTIKSSFYDYSDAYILVKGDIKVNAEDNTHLRLKIAHHFQHTKQINDVFVDEAYHIYITMLMHNLIE